MGTAIIVVDDPDGLSDDLPPSCRILAPDDLLDGATASTAST
jgi:hypothetical protein